MKKLFTNTLLVACAVSAVIYSCKKKDDPKPSASGTPTYADNTVMFGDSAIVWDAASTDYKNRSGSGTKSIKWTIDGKYSIHMQTKNYDTIKVGTYNLGTTNAKRLSTDAEAMYVSFEHLQNDEYYETTDSSTGTVTISMVENTKYVIFNDVKLFQFNDGTVIGSKNLNGKLTAVEKPNTPPVEESKPVESKPVVVGEVIAK